MNKPIPVAWIRRWAFDRETPKKVKTPRGGWAFPFKYRLHEITTAKCLEDDIPLFLEIEGLVEAAVKIVEEYNYMANEFDNSRLFKDIERLEQILVAAKIRSAT